MNQRVAIVGTAGSAQLNVSPRLTSDDLANNGLTNAKHSAEASLRKIAGIAQQADCDRIDIGKFRVLVPLSYQWTAAFLGFTVAVVVALRSSEQVRRVAARRIIALVKNAQALVEVWMRQRVRQSGRSPQTPTHFEDAVSVREVTSLPRPALGIARLQHMTPKIVNRIGLPSHV